MAFNPHPDLRQQALMRIGSNAEKQQMYEQRLYDTIDAKRKINQVMITTKQWHKSETFPLANWVLCPITFLSNCTTFYGVLYT